MTDMTFTAATAAHAELDLLACCLNGYDPRSTGITANHFDEPKHADLWRALVTVADSGREIDPGVVYDTLGPTYATESPWLFEVYSRPVMRSNAPSFAGQVRRAAELRDLQDVARGLMQRAMTGMADPDEARAWVRSKIDGPLGRTRTTQTFADVMPQVLEQIRSGQQAGLSTPWPDLDHKIHGLAPGRLYVFAARPGGGKSISGQNLAWHFSRKHEETVLFATMEMETSEVATRTVAQIAQVELDKLVTGNVRSDDDKRKVERAAELMSDARIHFVAASGQSVDDIRSDARNTQRRHGLGLVVVDYLQMLRARDERMGRREQVDEMARALKNLAMELHVPVVAMAQLNRESTKDKGRAPVLSDLRESGEIEQAADVVVMLHRPDPENAPEEGQMCVVKARNGSTGPVDVIMRTYFATIASPRKWAA